MARPPPPPQPARRAAPPTPGAPRPRLDRKLQRPIELEFVVRAGTGPEGGCNGSAMRHLRQGAPVRQPGEPRPQRHPPPLQPEPAAGPDRAEGRAEEAPGLHALPALRQGHEGDPAASRHRLKYPPELSRTPR